MEHPVTTRLAEHPLFAGLPASAIEEVARATRALRFDPGQAVITEGGEATDMYLVLAGHLALSAHAPGKGRLLIQTLGAGEVLGLSWLFAPYRWRFDAHAVEASELLALDALVLRAVVADDARFGYKFLMRVTPVVLDRLQQTRLRLLDLYSKGPDGDGGR
jgi:CRP-like cAMP-binding protein